MNLNKLKSRQAQHLTTEQINEMFNIYFQEVDQRFADAEQRISELEAKNRLYSN